MSSQQLGVMLALTLAPITVCVVVMLLRGYDLSLTLRRRRRRDDD